MNEFNYTSLIGEHKRDVKDGLSLKIKKYILIYTP